MSFRHPFAPFLIIATTTAAVMSHGAVYAALTRTTTVKESAMSAQTPHTRILRVRGFGDPVTLDWEKATTWIESFVIRNLMEGLVEIDSKLRAVPALAESWKTSHDHKVYTFRLRSGVKWSDGIPLKAGDFIAAWRRLLAPETGCRYASILFDIENAEKFNKGEIKDFTAVGVKAIDDRTLQVTLHAPVLYWHWIVSDVSTFPIRDDLVRREGERWTEPGRLVTLGPFTLSRQEPGKRIVLKRNANYFLQMGNLDQVEIALVYDDSKALKMYEDGSIDLLPKISSLEREHLRNRPDLRTWSDLRVIHLRLNTNRNPTAKAALRRAIAMAIDRPKLEALYKGAYEPATSFVPPGMLGFSKSGGLSFNPERARDELKKAGLTASALPPLDLLTVSFDDQVILAQFIQDELKRNLGLATRIHTFEPKRYYAPQLKHDDFAMQINFWGADFPDADSFYSVFLGAAGLNRYKWKDAEYDRLITAARSLPEKKARGKAYLQAQKILLEDAVATVPMYYARITALVRPTLQNYDPGALNWMAFKDISMK